MPLPASPLHVTRTGLHAMGWSWGRAELGADGNGARGLAGSSANRPSAPRFPALRSGLTAANGGSTRRFHPPLHSGRAGEGLWVAVGGSAWRSVGGPARLAGAGMIFVCESRGWECRPGGARGLAAASEVGPLWQHPPPLACPPPALPQPPPPVFFVRARGWPPGWGRLAVGSGGGALSGGAQRGWRGGVRAHGVGDQAWAGPAGLAAPAGGRAF